MRDITRIVTILCKDTWDADVKIFGDIAVTIGTRLTDDRELMDAIRWYVMDMLKTPYGKRAMKEAEGQFCWHDLLRYADWDTWTQYGFLILNVNRHCITVDMQERLDLVPEKTEATVSAIAKASYERYKDEGGQRT